MQQDTNDVASQVRAQPVGRAVAALIYAIFAGLVGLILYKFDLPLVDTLDRHLGDLRIAYGSPVAKAQRSDIAVVLVTEDTLLDYESRSPIDRRLLAELVGAVDAAGPKAIGLDFIFDRKTRHDAALIEALRQTKAPLVVGAIDQRVQDLRAESLAFQSAFLKAVGKPFGHLMLGRKEGLMAANDSVVRYVAQPMAQGRTAAGQTPNDTKPTRALSDALAVAAGLPTSAAVPTIAWLRAPDDRTPLFLTLAVPRHAADAVKPKLDGIFLPSWRELLKGRIVLIGATMVDRDRHITPLSAIDHATTAGIYIHAQALAQRLDGNRDIRRLPDWLIGLAASLVALTCFWAARLAGFQPTSFVYGLVGLVIIGFISTGAYTFFRIDFPSIALATAWAMGGIGGFFSSWGFNKWGLAA